MKRVALKIEGIVQGVGMRPTLFRYAQEFNLTGEVLNSAQGVFIEIQGTELQIHSFLEKLVRMPPPMAHIESIDQKEIPLIQNEKKFTIKFSDSLGEKEVAISPDLATCPECLEELFDPQNRRYHYPFINCTNCGPRFSIIRDRPYDRPLTSMASFPLCEQCQEEYENPLDRRFHAQPNACALCGPQLHLLRLNDDKKEEEKSDKRPLEMAIQALQEGKIVGIKGIGGFNLAVDPFNPQALERLRKVKNREEKAFALMASSIQLIKDWSFVTFEEEEELQSTRAPIVLLKKRKNFDSLHPLDQVAPDNDTLGMMLPYTPLHHLIMRHFPALIMTSANRADEPIAINDKEMMKLIEEGIAEMALSHNREILHRTDDSILQFIRGKKQLIRRSRGFVPRSIALKLPFESDASSTIPKFLSLGANMKNSFCFYHQKKITLSQHIGELIDLDNYHFQEQEIKNFSELLDFPLTQLEKGEPQYKTIIDAHPNYENYHRGDISCYHHHAHLLSVIGEHNIFNREIIGIIADGTGFGTDQTIWGCEFLRVAPPHLTEFKRIGHLENFPLPGGEIAIKEIDRIKYALLKMAGVDNGVDDNEKQDRAKSLFKLIDLKINSPLTSSLGRLFDGVASILGISDQANYEAQGAIKLQSRAEKGKYDFPSELKLPVVIQSVDDRKIIDIKAMIQKLVEYHLLKQASKEHLAYAFHLWIVESFLEMVKQLSPEKKELIALSGGVFQNRLLLTLLHDTLSEHGYEVLTNHEIPINDGGLSFGQTLYGILLNKNREDSSLCRL